MVGDIRLQLLIFFLAFMHEYTHLLLLTPYTFSQGGNVPGQEGRWGGGYKDKKERNV